jgi:TIR domain
VDDNVVAIKLSKSARVKVISDIATHLDEEDWTTIDLTLKQFGFPISDQWSGDKKSYVVGMIEDATDTDLVELGEHLGMQLGGGGQLSAAEPETPYWHDGQLRVFISHLTGHREIAAELQSAMKLFGISGFVAHNDINPTVEWQIEIETALATCDLLIALIHPEFVQSKWCDQEIGYALGRGIPVFAVRYGADPHGFVSRFQAFNGTGKAAHQIAKELFEAAIDHKKLQDKMADVIIDLFVNSGSFSTAKERMEYVERLKVWDTSYSARITKAVKTNSQVGSSWGVPEQVDALVKKWKQA